MQNNPLFSRTLHLGNSTFMLDVVNSEEGSRRYLRIREQTLKANGQIESQGILLNEDKVDEFAHAFKKMLMLMGKTDAFNTQSYIEAERMKYPKAYMPWKPEEDAHLEALIMHGKSFKFIAAVLDRKPSAIRSRVRKLKLH